MIRGNGNTSQQSSGEATSASGRCGPQEGRQSGSAAVAAPPGRARSSSWRARGTGCSHGEMWAGTGSGVPCHQIYCPLLRHGGTGWHSPQKREGDGPTNNQPSKSKQKKPHGSTNNPWTRVIVGEFQGWDFPFPLLRLQAAPSRTAAEGPRSAKHLLQNLKNLE